MSFPHSNRGNFDEPPPSYTAVRASKAAAASRTSPLYEKEHGMSRRNPRNWSRKCWIILALAIVIIIVVVVVVAVVVTRENRYPNYSKLNYALVDTFSGTSFFDNFYYYTGYDPADGFVQ